MKLLKLSKYCFNNFKLFRLFVGRGLDRRMKIDIQNMSARIVNQVFLPSPNVISIMKFKYQAYIIFAFTYVSRSHFRMKPKRCFSPNKTGWCPTKKKQKKWLVDKIWIITNLIINNYKSSSFILILFYGLINLLYEFMIYNLSINMLNLELSILYIC